MAQTPHLIYTLKQLLKARGVTYAQVAMHLGLSEASVKRQFSQRSFSMVTLEAICEVISFDLYGLVKAAEEADLKVHQLTEIQEIALLADPARLLTAVCVMNHWSIDHIVATYRLSEAACVGHLAALDRLGFIRLMPQNRVRLCLARDFSWRPDGPIQRFFRDRLQSDFLQPEFDQTGELLRFAHAMLTPEANQRFQLKLQRLVRDLADMHDECTDAPECQRFGTSLLFALRPWEPEAFASLRRVPDLRAFGTR